MQKKMQKIFTWFRKSRFWQMHELEYRELDLFTLVVFCEGLNINSFRIHVDWHRDYKLINIDTILPYEYNTEVGLGMIKTGLIKKERIFASYQRPPMYTEQRVQGIINASIMQGISDPLSDLLNSDGILMRTIKKLPHNAYKTVSAGEGSTRVKIHEIFVPIMFMQDENGVNIRLSTHYSRRKAKADILILGVLDKLAYKVRSLNLPTVVNIADDIDSLLNVYAKWETDGFGKKVTQQQYSTPSAQNSKYCPKCGKALELNAKFCSECGYNFGTRENF